MTGAAADRPGATLTKPSLLKRSSLVPGLAVTAAITAVALVVNRWQPLLSALLLAIVLGAVVGNVRPVPPRWQPGLSFAARRLLRLGIVLLGLQITLSALASLGWQRLILVVVVVTSGVLGTLAAGRLLRVPARLTALVACGFSICGAAAVAGAEDVVGADEEETGTALMLVVLFGTLSIPVLPAAATLIGLDTTSAATWAGASVHEVAQVVAAAATIGSDAIAVAVPIKLARVLCLAGVVAGYGLAFRGTSAAGPQLRGRPSLVPGFVVGFLAMVVVGSVVSLPASVLGVAKTIQTAALAMAMAALGISMQARSLRNVGWRPFLLGLVATLIVSLVALTGVLLIG
ncbi:MAG: putative sulfate exporter family transporter [Brooklawnia sp.]|nr:putative sulfate exporter family transporter [Brooklawnia sp.]